MNVQRALWISVVAVTVLSFGAGSAEAYFGFGTPVSLKSVIPIIDPAHDCIGCLSYDGLEMYIISASGYAHDNDLRVLRRVSTDGDWGPPENLGPVVNSANPNDDDSMPSISADGLMLYFHSNRAGGYGSWDIYVTTRATKNAPWGPPANLGPKVNGSSSDVGPWISANGLELYFHSWRPGGYGKADIWVARRATEGDPWGEPVNLGPALNSADDDVWPSSSPDGVLLFFCTVNRAGGYGGEDMWMTRRATLSGPWGTPGNLGPKVNIFAYDDTPRISPNGRTLYFWTARTTAPDTWDNWQAPIIPIVDFNADGKVDSKDRDILMAHSGQNDPLCDIGPFAWGDGVVDDKDLAVLGEYAGRDVVDPTLMAHWALDETEGVVAHDSVGKNDALVIGTAGWQAEAGKVGGALQLSGVMNFATTKFARDPAQGPFSIWAWVKGGAPGQVILSQVGGATWLLAAAPDGALATELKESGRNGKPLLSQTAITGGDWHRVGLVWDGASRTLYCDGLEVATDTQAGLAGATGTLILGAAANLAPGTSWSGLIDDIRIYDRAVKP